MIELKAVQKKAYSNKGENLKNERITTYLIRVSLHIFCVMFIFLSTSHAQDNDSTEDSLAYEKFLMMVNANREQSYLTIGSGIGNLEPLLLEAKLSPSYFFSRNRHRWAVMINPQVQIRMLNERSLPIRNPSYRVYATVYKELEFWKQSPLRKVFFENALLYFSWVHHSNGQDGPFYVSDTTREINFEDGNFATNFFQLGLSTYRVNKFSKHYFSIREIKALVEYYPPNWYSEGLKDRYGSYRVYANAGIVGPRKKITQERIMRWLQRSSLEIKAGWIFGKMPDASPLEASDRLVIDLWYKYYPVWFDEIALFVRFYRGQDYYNILFAKDPISNLSIGITSNIINYKQAVRFFK